MTRAEIEVAIYQRLDKNVASIDPTTEARIRSFVAQRLRRLLTIPGLTRARLDTISVTSTASQPRLGLPYAVARIHRIWDPTTQIALRQQSLDDLRASDPGQVSSGTPVVYVPIGYQAVAQQPSNASTLYVKSSTGDATQTAYLEGFDVNGLPLVSSVTLAGTTAVPFTGSVGTVTKFYLSAVPLGTVTLHEDSGSGTQLGAIGIGRTEGAVYSVILWPTPSTALPYSVDYERRITDLAQGTDIPPIPEDFHDLLILGGTLDEYQRTSDERWPVAMAEYTRREKELKAWLWWGNGAQPVAGWRPTQAPSWSPAGGWFPPVSGW